MLPLARKSQLVVQESGDELLVYDLKMNKALCLNRTSALIWTNCDGTKSPWEICNQLRKKLSADISEDLVWFGLEELKREGLISEGEEFPDRFFGQERREVVRKLGVGASVALPIVASLAAPTALEAQSVCVADAPGCAPNGNVGCTSPNDCCSCTCMTSNGNCVMS